jgi:hypothetical protein
MLCFEYYRIWSKYFICFRGYGDRCSLRCELQCWLRIQEGFRLCQIRLLINWFFLNVFSMLFVLVFVSGFLWVDVKDQSLSVFCFQVEYIRRRLKFSWWMTHLHSNSSFLRLQLAGPKIIAQCILQDDQVQKAWDRFYFIRLSNQLWQAMVNFLFIDNCWFFGQGLGVVDW